jgi:D-alanyl-D-alanine-carboxypeptidase/D-alanyl-D-alanine-endopeptidase
MTRRFVVGIALAASAMGQLDAQPAAPPSDAEVRQILVDRIDRDHQSIGIVVGLVGSTGRRVIAYGALDKGDSRPLNGDTISEIGSVTKVFTSLLLADMAARHEVALSDPIANYLQSDVRVPVRNGQSITLQDLATHTSGLPRLPMNFNPKDPAVPPDGLGWIVNRPSNACLPV